MEVWSGDVSLGDGAGKIQDVHLEYAQPTSRLRLSSSAELRFLSLVDATGIPLHLAAGPSLGVWTTSEHTEAWFYDNIIGDDIAGRVSTDGAGPHRDPWWCRGGGQSDWGILLGVDQGTVSDGQVGPKITEILLYASMEVDQVGNMALPTPPASSSPSPDAAGHDALSESARRQARIYALPLSSELLHRYDISQASQSLPTESANDGHGQFLQLPVDDHNPPSGASQKRSRISSLFEDATQRQKKVKRKGGVSISEVMASLERPPSSHGHGLSTLKRGLEEDAVDLVNENPQQTQTQRVGLSRSASAASLGARRPSSRRVITDRKAALLRRIASVATLDNISLMPAGEISIEQQNKNALSRLVMAGMRIYGLQQRKKASRSRAVSEAASSTGITQGPAQTQESDDEYKLVYHQAFKAASFTFRKSIATRIVSQEAMRDVVDRLLALFCTDPSDKNEINDGFGGDWEEGRGNFDPPSGRAVTRAGDGGWSTPTTRKRHRDGSHQAMVEVMASPTRRSSVPAVT